MGSGTPVRLVPVDGGRVPSDARWLVVPPGTRVVDGAVALIAVGNVVSIDGLGRDGWRSLLDRAVGLARPRSDEENFAYRPFSYHLDLAHRERSNDDDRIVSGDGRLGYFFPGRVDMAYNSTIVRRARWRAILHSFF